MAAHVDVSDIKTYADFERRFDELIEQIAAVLTEDHTWQDFQVKENPYGLMLPDGTRVVSNEDRSNYGSVSVVVNDDGTALVSGPERGEPAAWGSQRTIHGALGTTVVKALLGPATNFANRRSAEPELVADLKSAELVRLLRILDDEWADRIEKHNVV